MKMTYQPVKVLCKLIYDYEPSSVTVDRWRRGANAKGLKLHMVKLGGRLLTTETHLREFLEGREEETVGRSTCQPKTRGENARARAVEAANKELEEAGI